NQLILAMTHSSYANENKHERLSSNERLEFLGDAVLNIIISDHIYKYYTSLPEGELTKARASIVCEPSLAKCANMLELGKYLMLGKGEEYTGGRTRISILSDAFEAVIGSIYIDGGMEKAREFVLHFMEEAITNSIKGASFIDFKTQLQEVVQKTGDQKIHYEIIEEKGPDHDKLFTIQVNVASRVLGSGKGKTKKEAEQNAASIALARLQGTL
ncbi:MAG: ribonuclease III, partial [Ruminiclostridium sp.]|nr:ribonuclease III [Ruminiclostridium sp.]